MIQRLGLASQKTQTKMEKVRRASPAKLASLIQQAKDPKIAFQLFLNNYPTHTHKGRYSLICYDDLICKLGRAKMVEEIDRVIQILRDDTRFAPQEVIFCNLISSYGRAGQAHRAIGTFYHIPEFRCQRTIKSVNSLLNALAHCRKFGKMDEILARIDEFAEPDLSTYNILIHACCSRGDLSKALKVFDEMRSRGPLPDVVTFGTLIGGLCSSLEVEKALELKEMMVREFKVRPNANAYAALIKGLCKDGKLDSAVKLKKEMLRWGMRPDSATYGALIYGFFKSGRKEEIQGLMDEMKRIKCHSKTIAYNAMIQGHCEEGDFDSAFKILDEMADKGAMPDMVSYSIIIMELCKNGMLREANELFEDMPRRNHRPDVVIYRILFDGMCDGKQYERAMQILDEMVFKGFMLLDESATKFFTGLVQNGDMKLLLRALNTLARAKLTNADIWRMAVSIFCKEDKLFDVSEIVSSSTVGSVDSVP